ncbi:MULTISPECIES: hypothetical protein [Methylosinus]|uniref:Uncharacterized protein n=1 Tax=Methylosinus sporium TaxID=428 RepID=A0A2U1SNH9_METSR|nr:MULTISPECIES: hypothetical protein [Methylosinus]MBU3886878.1 hypothetical protein [Methylosinus sp. KRF6]PWB93156.1 hypothetical protein C5689_14270 [Methylosinus sporium]TRL36523.1 hypothetical protein FM996_04485 [Methylosinus sporium]
MIDECKGEFHSASDSPKLSRRALLAGLLALPVAALDAGSAEAQSIGIGPLQLNLGPTGGYGGGYPYRTRRPPPRQRVHHSGGGSRHASRRSRRNEGGGQASGGGDKGGSPASGATGLGKLDY